MSAHAIVEPKQHPADFLTGFELGWDHARFKVTPPTEHLTAFSPVYQGFHSGQAAFGNRAKLATRHVRKWLQLRLNAWLRGRAFEGMQVTPNYLSQIDTDYCPITREALTHQTCTPSDASVDRVRNDAAYAAGNLVVMSACANRAKSDYAADDAMSFVRQIEVGRLGKIDGLGAAEWARLAILMSYVTDLPHTQALMLPMLVLPPNRLRLLNPIQGLQAAVTLQVAQPGFSGRLHRIETCIRGKSLRRDFRLFVGALLPRVLKLGRMPDRQERRWALEDAWRNPLVNRCWQRFARQLSAGQVEGVLSRIAVAKDLGAARFITLRSEQATDGWALETGGYVQVIESMPLPTLVMHKNHDAPARPALPTWNSAAHHRLSSPAALGTLHL